MRLGCDPCNISNEVFPFKVEIEQWFFIHVVCWEASLHNDSGIPDLSNIALVMVWFSHWAILFYCSEAWTVSSLIIPYFTKWSFIAALVYSPPWSDPKILILLWFFTGCSRIILTQQKWPMSRVRMMWYGAILIQ